MPKRNPESQANTWTEVITLKDGSKRTVHYNGSIIVMMVDTKKLPGGATWTVHHIRSEKTPVLYNTDTIKRSDEIPRVEIKSPFNEYSTSSDDILFLWDIEGKKLVDYNYIKPSYPFK